MQKVYAVISRFWRICDFRVYATIQIGRFQSGIIVFNGVILNYEKTNNCNHQITYNIFMTNHLSKSRYKKGLHCPSNYG